jgi:hypothetical protein
MRTINNVQGSLQHFIDKAVDFSPYRSNIKEMEYYKIGLFDYIIGNYDRNVSNMLYYKKPVLIDNGSAFPDSINSVGTEHLVCAPLELRNRFWKLDDVIEPYDKKYLLEGISRIDTCRFRTEFNMSKREIASLGIRLKLASDAIEKEELNDLLYSLIN